MHPPRVAVRASSAAEDAATSSGEGYEFTYHGSDGRMKATFEQAFKGGARSGDPSVAQPALPPWHIGYQMSERDLAWNDGLRARLLARTAAAQLQMSDDALDAALARLQALLPGLAGKLPGMRTDAVTRLLTEIDAIPARLVALKAVFPGASASKLAIRAPDLILGFFDEDHLRRLADRLHELLPDLDVDRLVEENPAMLDVEELQVAMAEAARIMPSLDIQKVRPAARRHARLHRLPAVVGTRPATLCAGVFD